MKKICGECMHYLHGQLESPCGKGDKFCGYLIENKNCWEQKEGEAIGDTRKKLCPQCGKELPAAMFYKYQYTKDKLSVLCKVCKPYRRNKN